MKFTFSVLVILAVALLFGTDFEPSARGQSQRQTQPCVSQSNYDRVGVIFYSVVSLYGYCIKFEAPNSLFTSGVIRANLADYGFANRARSLKIAGNYRVTVYTGINQTGNSATVVGDVNYIYNLVLPNNDSFDLNIQSVEIEYWKTNNPCYRGGGVHLFARQACQGQAYSLYAGEDLPNLENLTRRGGNAVTSIVPQSLSVEGEYAITLFRDRNYGGPGNWTKTYRNDVQKLATWIQGPGDYPGIPYSLKMRAGNCNLRNAPSGVFLYSESNFRGRCTRLTKSTSDLRLEYVGNDVLASIRIIGQYPIEAYVEANYFGEVLKASEDLRDIRNTRAYRGGISSVKVYDWQNDQCLSLSGVYFYSEPNYQGKCYWMGFTQPINALYKLFPIRSLQIVNFYGLT